MNLLRTTYSQGKEVVFAGFIVSIIIKLLSKSPRN